LDALKILKRVMSLADLFILANSASFTELEQEKNMPTGGFLRQCLRLSNRKFLFGISFHTIFAFSAMTNAVRHCMECRFQRFDPSLTSKPSQPMKSPMRDPIEALLELTYLTNPPPETNLNENIDILIASFIKNPESVLQDIDIQRLRAIIYRDVVRPERNKAGKNVVVVVVNFSNICLSFALCVLCCIDC
jgi:hypothetical protein